MNNHRLHNIVYARLEAIAAAEKITRKELAELSRELLIYVVETQDIDIVNRLIQILTPMNKRAAILYFGHFLPWSKETDDDGVFTRFGKKMSGDKKVKRKLEEITAWLIDESNNIWVWSDANIEVKQKDFKATVSRAIKRALEGDEKSNTPALTSAELMDAIFEGGVSIDDLLLGIMAKEEQIKEAENNIALTQEQIAA